MQAKSHKLYPVFPYTLSFKDKEVKECIACHEEEYTDHGIFDSRFRFFDLFVISGTCEDQKSSIDNENDRDESDEAVEIIDSLGHDLDGGTEVRRTYLTDTYTQEARIAGRLSIDALDQCPRNLQDQESDDREYDGLFPFFGLILGTSGGDDHIESVECHGKESERGEQLEHADERIDDLVHEIEGRGARDLLVEERGDEDIRYLHDDDTERGIKYAKTPFLGIFIAPVRKDDLDDHDEEIHDCEKRHDVFQVSCYGDQEIFCTSLSGDISREEVVPEP